MQILFLDRFKMSSTCAKWPLIFIFALSISLLMGIIVGLETDKEKEADVKAKCENEKIKDLLNFEAIKSLHKSMDDDLSGTVDLSESIEFVREELRITEKDRLDKRQKAFHHNNDEFVTLDDLWCRWVQAGERHWNTDKLLEWLQYDLELPRYTSVFASHKINGSMLPRISDHTSNFLVTDLGITNPVHRQKIQLKAMDVVLFGYRSHRTSIWKDAILIGLLCLAAGGYWFAVAQRSVAQKEASRLSSQMDKLKDIEHDFLFLQEKFHEEKRKNKPDDSEKTEQIENLKHQLLSAEKKWEKKTPALVHLLRKTYDLEIQRINQQKTASLREMAEARDMVEKFRRKQVTFLSQIRSVHGVDMENIDQRILSLKQKLEETAHAIEECHQRWTLIETLCGFSVTSPGSSAPGTCHVTGARSNTNFMGEGEELTNEGFGQNGCEGGSGSQHGSFRPEVTASERNDASRTAAFYFSGSLDSSHRSVSASDLSPTSDLMRNSASSVDLKVSQLLHQRHQQQPRWATGGAQPSNMTRTFTQLSWGSNNHSAGSESPGSSDLPASKKKFYRFRLFKKKKDAD